MHHKIASGLRLLGAAACLGSVAVRLTAQVEEDPVLVPVQIALTTGLMGQGGWSSAGFNVNGYGNVVTVNTPQSAQFAVNASLAPGKSYTMTLTCSNVYYAYNLYMAAPTGYRVLVESVERYGLIYTNGSGLVTGVPSTVTIRVDSGEGAGPGEASSLRPGRLIWTMGLGSLKNGQSAGVISLRQSNISALSAADYQASALVYNSPGAEVLLNYGTGPDAGKSQIFASQCLAQMEPLTGGQEGFLVKFYSRYDISTTQTNGLWVPNGGALPFVDYRVENTTPFSYSTTAKLRITKTSRLNSSGHSTTNTWRSELRQVSGQPAGTTKWEVLDWTTNGVDGTNNLIKGDSWSQWTYTNSGTNEDIQVFNAAGTLAARTYNIYQAFAWGSELIQSTSGYGGTNPLTTQYGYYTNSTQWGNYTRLQYRIEPTGKWIRYSYSDSTNKMGRILATYEPWLTSPTSPTGADYANGLVTTFDYASDWTGMQTRPSSIVRTVGSTTLSKTTIGYTDTSVAENVVYSGTTYAVTRYLVQATSNSYYNSSQYLTSVARAYREDAGMGLLPNGQYEKTRGFLPGLPYDATAADGTRSVWTYTRGLRDAWFWGFIPDSQGTEWYVRQESQGPSGALVNGGSTFSGQIRAADGTVLVSDTGIYVQGAWQTTKQTRSLFLNGVVPLEIHENAGTYSLDWWIAGTMTWDGGLLVGERDKAGIEHAYGYNGSAWRSSDTFKQKSSVPANDIITYSSYDGAGRVTGSRTQASTTQNVDDAISTSIYDTAGRILTQAQSGPNGNLTTSYVYFYGGDSKSVQVTLPNGGTRVASTYLDGRPSSASGTALYGGGLSNVYTYGYDASGNAWAKETPPTNGYTYQISDWLGRPIRSTTPGYNSARVATVFAYDATNGRLTKKQTVQADASDNASFASTPMASPTLYAYDSLGRVTRACLDVNENGAIDLGGPDRINEYAYSASVVGQSVSGFGTINMVWGQKDTYAYVDGSSTPVRQTSQLQQLNEYATGTYVTPTIYQQAKTRNAHYNGSNESATTVFATTTIQPASATIVSTTQYPGITSIATTTTTNGFVVSSTSETGATATYSYDSYGRRSQVQGRAAVLESFTFYPGTSAIKNTRNAGLYPGSLGGNEWQTRFYDTAGRLVRHEVNQNGAFVNTRHEYDLRGNLLRTWGAGAQPVEYVFDNLNRRTGMKLFRGAPSGGSWDTGTWPGATATADLTQWGYDATTSLVTSKTYPTFGGITAVINFVYSGFNQLTTRTWARGTQTQYTYYGAGETADGARGELKQVSYPNSGSTGQNITTAPVTYKYARIGAVRDVVETLAGTASTRTFTYRTGSDLQVATQSLGAFYGNNGKGFTYNYDTSVAVGRYTGFGLGHSTNASAYQTNGYGYHATTGRLDSITAWDAPGNNSRTFTYGYEPGSNFVNTVTSGSYGRTNLWQGWRNLVDYAVTTWGGATKANLHYDYDWIERRMGEDHNDELSAQLGYGGGIKHNYLFTPKGELDWVDARWMYNNSQITDRYRDWTYDHAGNREYEQRSGAATDHVVNNLNQYTSADTAHTYDADGNLINDGVWWYYWDAENRLAVAQKQDWSSRLELAYDYQNRRVSKLVRNAALQVVSNRRFVYDGWNLVSEIDTMTGGATFTVARAFHWGLDVTHTIQGGGGVGGLLMIGDAATVHLPVYDANGNVRGLLHGGTGAWTAAYAYSAFGEIVYTNGSYATANPFRFASKWYDTETGLYQYNNRYYSPKLGRFLSRDPIEENGGLNLYGYCGNDPIGHWDYLGQSWLSSFFKKVGNAISKVWKVIKPYVKIVAAVAVSYFAGQFAYSWLSNALNGLKGVAGTLIREGVATVGRSVVRGVVRSEVLGTSFNVRAGVIDGFADFGIDKLNTAFPRFALPTPTTTATVTASPSIFVDHLSGAALRGSIRGVAAELKGGSFSDGLHGSLKNDYLKIYRGDVESQVNSVWASSGIHAGTISLGPIGTIDVDKALKDTAVSFAVARESTRINHQTAHGSTLFYNAATGAILGQIYDPLKPTAVNFRDPLSYLRVLAYATDRSIATSLVAMGRGQNQATAFGSAFSGEVTTWSESFIKDAFPEARVNATFDKLYHGIFGP